MTSIPAIYKTELVTVLDVWEAGGRKVALIQSLDGHNWPAWTHGGWSEDNTKTVPASLLHPVEECSCNPLAVTACGACRLAIAQSEAVTL